MKMPSAKVRRYVYRVATATLAAAAVYGLCTGEQAAALLLVVAAVTGMADVNTDTSS